MDKKDRYIAYLETIIKTELYPIYEKYHLDNDLKIPVLDLPFIQTKKPLPVLLRGFLMLTPDEREPRNN